MAGILMVEIIPGVLTEVRTGPSLSERPTIIFEDPNAPGGGIDNTGQAFPTGMTDSATDQVTKPQA